MAHEVLKKLVKLVVEARLREVDVTDGTAPHGSEKHISDLKGRIEDLTKWRDRQRRGSEARANYSRLIARLRTELKSAQRAAQKIHLTSEDEEK
jgi:hypothetical protein